MKKSIKQGNSVTLLLAISLLTLSLVVPTALGSQDDPPVASFLYSPSSPSTEDTVHFSNETSITDGYIVEYTWKFGDGTTSSKKNPNHYYLAPGTYTVTLTVTDNYGATDTCSKNVTVSNIQPDADFSFTPSSPSRNIIQFKDNSSDDDGDITSWKWEFGDGKSSKMQNPSHRYEESGTYTVTLTVTDEYGATDTRNKEVTVSSIKAPQISAVEAGKEEVARLGENLTISFQIHEESGINNIRTVEIWVKDENGKTESYDNWPGGNIKAIKNTSPYENSYSLTFDPGSAFNVGEASLEVSTINEYGLEKTVKVENLFEVTTGEATVETENASGLKRGEATLSASINYGAYDKVDVTFYYREKGEEWESTGWENDYTYKDYTDKIAGIRKNKVYEFRAGIRYGSSGNLFDNGSTVSFTENSEVMLIQEELVEATKGEPTVVSLEIANLSSEEIEAVRVIPPENYSIMPSIRWIGSMDVDSYLPADFRLYTENMKDEENLTFHALYQTSDKTYKSPPITVNVNLKNPDKDFGRFFTIIPIIAIIVVVLITILYFRRWR